MAISTITAASAFVIAVGAATLGSRMHDDSPEAGAFAGSAHASTTCMALPKTGSGTSDDRHLAAVSLDCANPMSPPSFSRGYWESLAQAFPR